MSLAHDFIASDFRSLSREEQIAKCHAMAREALNLAATCSEEKRAQYFDLAARWTSLARDMENTRGD